MSHTMIPPPIDLIRQAHGDALASTLETMWTAIMIHDVETRRGFASEGILTTGGGATARVLNTSADVDGKTLAVLENANIFIQHLYVTKTGNTELMTSSTGTGTVTGGVQALQGATVRLGSITAHATELVANNIVGATLNATATSLGVGVVPSGNGAFQVKAGNQTTNIAKVGGTLFHGTSTDSIVQSAGETDTLAVTVESNTFNVVGDALFGVYHGTLFSNDLGGAVSFRFRIKLGATTAWEYTASITSSGAAYAWTLRFVLIRSTSTLTIGEGTLAIDGLAIAVKTISASGPDLTTDLALKMTATVTNADDDTSTINPKWYFLEWKSAA